MKSCKKADETQKFCILDRNNSREELPGIVLAYIDYYHNRANLYKYAYRGLSILKYLALAVIPVIQASPAADKFSWTVAIFSSLCILLDSVINLFQMKEKWILYRNTNCKLMSEQRQYQLRMGGYYGLDSEKMMQLFVSRIEEIVGGESKEWRETVLKPEAQQK